MRQLLPSLHDMHAGVLQEVREGEEPQDFFQALQQCAEEMGRGSLPQCARCSWLGPQYEVSLMHQTIALHSACAQQPRA